MTQFHKLPGMWLTAAMLLAVSTGIGCSNFEEPSADATAATEPDEAYLLTERPADALGVAQVRQKYEKLSEQLAATPPASENEEEAAAPTAPETAAAEPVANKTAAATATPAEGERVTMTGRIGGSVEPFVDGIAAFTIVDPAIPFCAAEEGCPTPWDYCCQQDKMKENSAMVKVVGGDGKAVAIDARKLLGVKELSEVVVQGKVERDAAGNLVVLANKVHVVKK